MQKTSTFKKIYISLEIVLFVGLYCIIILQCTVKKIVKFITLFAQKKRSKGKLPICKQGANPAVFDYHFLVNKNHDR